MEAIATLCYVKRNMAEFVLKPSGVPPGVYEPLFSRRNELGKLMSKREMAPLILQGCDPTPGSNFVARRILEIAASWSKFDLAENEYAARAVTQKARELLGVIETMEAREARVREIAREEEINNLEKERWEILRRESTLLLLMFEELVRLPDPHRRGYLLQDLLNRLFVVHGVPVIKPFIRNEGAEQIDGAFKLEGWHYLVECRWREKVADTSQLDGLVGKVNRSGKQSMGLFCSVNGWSQHVPGTLKQNPDKSVVLMDGYDLRCILSLDADLNDFLEAKLAHLNLRAEPFLGVKDFLDRRT